MVAPNAILCSLVLAALLVVSASGVPTQLTYTKGQEFVFGMGSTVDARHADSATLQPGGGSIAGMASTVAYQCTDLDDTSYLFVMNMFDTTVNVAQNAQPSAVGEEVFDNAGIPVLTDSGGALGQNMYFQQLKTGEIIKIWYSSGDSPFFVNVKVGAISQFQTRIVPGNKQDFTYQETDLIGTHTSQFLGTTNADSSLSVAKTFNQKDFSSWATDANLQSKDIILDASQGVNVHPQGYIQSTAFSQKVLLVQTTVQEQQTNAAPDNNGFNMLMLSNGQMNVKLQQIRSADSVDSAFASADVHTFSSLEVQANSPNSSLMADTFDGYAAKAALLQLKRAAPADMNVTQELAKIFALEESGARAFSQMNKLVRYLNVNRDEVPLVKEYLSQAGVSLNNNVLRARLMYLIAALNDGIALIELGLNSAEPTTRMHAIMTASAMREPTAELAYALLAVTKSPLEDAKMKHAAMLAYGTVLGRLYTEDARQGGKVLLDMFLTTPSSEAGLLSTLLAAIRNAGPAVIPTTQVVPHALRLFKRVPSLRVSVRRMLEEFVPEEQQILDATAVALVNQSDFPFNRSWTKDLIIGGRDVNLDLHAELFAGTNFDCNQQYFNYEALAEITGAVTLFTESADVFAAEAVYGADNGMHLADSFSLTFLGRTLIDEPFPQVDCSEHTYNLFHAAPVLSASYVVWISVIPVVFSANAGVTLNVDWGWSICDSELSALIELIPGAEFQASGDVSLDLLIIKAGIELAVGVNQQVHPQGYIHGSECEVGFDIERTNAPMDAYFESFFQLESCILWIFDCKWKDRNTQVWWSWNQPESSTILFNEDWKIKL